MDESARKCISSSRSDCLTKMLDWLSSRGATLSKVTFDSSEECGGSLGCMGETAFNKGDVFFSIPQECIFGLHQTKDTSFSLALLASVKDHSRVTAELLIWLHMIQSRNDSNSFFYPYFSTLDNRSPSPLQWPAGLQQEALLETTLYTFLQDIKASLERHCELLQEARVYYADDAITLALLDPAVYNYESLQWARGHYLARRYPGKHAVDCSVADSSLGREFGLEDLGVLVPVLDILNHDHGEEHLVLRVEGECLQIICNNPTAARAELYSNYGELSNERLLFAYGFALDSNPFDTFTCRLRAAAHDGTVDLGTYYINRSGMAGVPVELWRVLAEMGGEDRRDPDEPCEVSVDEISVLLSYAQSKLAAFAKVEESVQCALTQWGSTHSTLCSYISSYREGQKVILDELVADLVDAIEEAGGGPENEGEESEEEV